MTATTLTDLGVTVAYLAVMGRLFVLHHCWQRVTYRLGEISRRPTSLRRAWRRFDHWLNRLGGQ